MVQVAAASAVPDRPRGAGSSGCGLRRRDPLERERYLGVVEFRKESGLRAQAGGICAGRGESRRSRV
jgi:hypothetical protein